MPYAYVVLFLMLLFWWEYYRVFFMIFAGSVGVLCLQLPALMEVVVTEDRKELSVSTGFGLFGVTDWWLEALFPPWYFPNGKRILITYSPELEKEQIKQKGLVKNNRS